MKKLEKIPIFLKKILAKWESFYYNSSAWAKRLMTSSNHTPGDRTPSASQGAVSARLKRGGGKNKRRKSKWLSYL